MTLRELMGLPVLASEHGKNVDDLIIYMHMLMAVLFVGWIIYFFYVLIRFNHKANPKADYRGVTGHLSSWIEGIVAAIELAILFGMAIPLWASAVNHLPAESESTVIRVVAQQFGWNVRYPGSDKLFGKQDPKLVSSNNKFGVDPKAPNAADDFETFNNMHIPLNESVIVHISSLDVIHSFKVIALRVCQDAIPGISIPVWFKAITPGRYQINCAQLCGNGHANMTQGFITIESRADFDKFVSDEVKKKSAGGGSTSFE